MTSKFWIVVSESRGPSDWPSRHNTEQSAFNEAGRLARNHPGKFFVFEAIGACIKQDVITARFDGSDYIPF